VRGTWRLSIQAAVLLAAASAFAAAPTPSNHPNVAELEAEKAAGSNPTTPPDPIYIDVGGDTIGSATVIPSVPYWDGGNTCQFVHNYDEICPFTGSTSPDVVYSYTPVGNITISIDLCSSSYDTKVYVYENSVGNLVACNDDACGSDGFRSELESVDLIAGNTYYIVVDGYFGDCGEYFMMVSEVIICCGSIQCPPAGILEGEPECHENYGDTYNGGCNSDPPVFTFLPCSDPGETTTVCGEYGGFYYFGSSYRDTDWYRMFLEETSTISWCVAGLDDTLLGIIDGNGGCPVSAFYDYEFAEPCWEECVEAVLPPGTWWLYVATSSFGSSAVPCGSEYVAKLTGYNCRPLSVEPVSWGRVKDLYR
jgi:hypothetical protein